MYTVRWFRNFAEADYLQVVAYETLNPEQFNIGDIVVFCDIDRCNDLELEDLKIAYSAILNSGCRILNDPSKAMRRYELLQGLYSSHNNDFQVYRPDKLPSKEKVCFPVFVRDELEHNGPDTELLYSYEELEEILAKNPPPNPLVCEFIDTRFKGHHHKYGAFILDGKIIPRHFFLSDAWNVKSGSGDIELSQQMEVDYVLENPHEKELSKIAKFAQIEFGRIDYAMTDKGLQVFEINTNPTLISRHDVLEGNPRSFITRQFIDTISNEFKNLKPAKHHDY